MLKAGILNPAILSLLARVRHTNALVIADRGFPCWPQIDTVDISLVDGIPTVTQVVSAIRLQFAPGRAFMAEEFLARNGERTKAEFALALQDVPLIYEPHEASFKKRVPGAIGLIRTGDATQYANVILVSA